MNTYKILSIEDNEGDYTEFCESVARYNDEDRENKFEIQNAKTFEEGMSTITEDFDAVMVDMKLDDGHDGNDIIQEIIKNYRLPVLIFTGTPDVQNEVSVKVFVKGSTDHGDILKYIKSINDTGIFRVLGGRGLIEEMLQNVFWNNIWPVSSEFMKYPSAGLEKKILRYAIADMREYLDQDAGDYLTEETYIYPPAFPSVISTGNIYENQEKWYIVLSPPCDLAIHEDHIKTDSVLVCQIEMEKPVFENAKGTTTSDSKLVKIFTEVIKNKHTEYYHWLPSYSLFRGGIINFRKVETYSEDEFREKFGDAKIKVHEFYVKNIMNRFSSYYSRQGQPDFEFDKLARAVLDKYFR